MRNFNDFNNSQVANLPKHLKQFIVDQNYEKYTPIDHAVWRYVMRQNYSYLKNVAYYPYIKGLQIAGLTIESIPNLQKMNDSLGKIGWGAVTVDGFIPPAAFMEFQAYHVLVIAADIRQINHIEYTPAPDIIHESAGHAPIIADAEYSSYLSYFGSIGSKAMFSKKDFELYEAIRELSILKEAQDSTPEEIELAESKLQAISNNMGEPSEMALLSRLHWWTVEYGLIGTVDNPKIYGAGLLSSIGESATCMSKEVPKLVYDSNAVHYSYDITKPQPQLFVTPNFQNLMDVLEDFANSMAFRTGGVSGITKAIECENICTAVYSSGIQVTGVFSLFYKDQNDNLSFIKTVGPTSLSFNNHELPNQGSDYHTAGFSSPVGRLKYLEVPLEDASQEDLERLNLATGNFVKLVFESGIQVTGTVINILKNNDKIILISFDNCTVLDQDLKELFLPEWGLFDMAVGQQIVSVFNGVADKSKYDIQEPEINKKKESIRFSDEELRLQTIYATIRQIREQQEGFSKLPELAQEIMDNYPLEWLSLLEIFEITTMANFDSLFTTSLLKHLKIKIEEKPNFSKLISDGLKAIETLS
jgi:phenylalanine-4-hydroxylase